MSTPLSLTRPALLQHRRHVPMQPLTHVHIASPTVTTSPSGTYASSAQAAAVPPLRPSAAARPPLLLSHPLPPLPPTVAFSTFASPSSLLSHTLPPLALHRPAPAEQERSVTAVSLRRLGSGASYLFSSSRNSASRDREDSVSAMSAASVSRAQSSSRRSQLQSDNRLHTRAVSPSVLPAHYEDRRPAAPLPPAPPGQPHAAAPASVFVPPSSLPFPDASASWSVFFLSLPASAAFLRRLSVALLLLHSTLLLLSLLFFLLVSLLSSSPFADPLAAYLLFYAARSACSLSMTAYRMRHSECWPDDGAAADSASSSRSSRYHALQHMLGCISIAATAVTSWLLFSGYADAGDSGAGADLVHGSVLALLVVEYAAIALPLLCNFALSFFVPCVHLSFYLPYLPFPAAAAAFAGQEEPKPGMTEADLIALPHSLYRASITHSSQAVISRDSEEIICAVCLVDVKEGEEVRELRCRHVYHRLCIDGWLRKRATCPLCVRKVSVQQQQSRMAAAAAAAVAALEMTAVAADSAQTAAAAAAVVDNSSDITTQAVTPTVSVGNSAAVGEMLE